MSATTVQTRAAAVTWIETIYDQVQEAIVNQKIFWEIQEVIAGNKQLRETPSHVFDWMASLFVHSTLMAIRRQLDRGNDAVSITRLLREVQKDPDVIDRKTFVSLYPPDQAARGEEDFDRFVGVGREQIDPKQVQADLDELQAKGAGIGKYATAIVAHYLDKPKPPAGTFDDLAACIECIWGLTNRYRILLTGVATADPVPTFAYDWKEVFRIPWIS